MKKALIIFFVIILFTSVLSSLTVLAAGDDKDFWDNNYVLDESLILTDVQIENLNAKAAAIAEEWGCTVYIWIVDLVPKEYDKTVDDVEAYVDKFFYEKYDLGYGDDKNGMVLLLETGDVPGERDYLFYTQGSCTLIFNDRRRERICDNEIVPLFKKAFDNGNFYKVADTFYDITKDYFTARSGDAPSLDDDKLFSFPVDKAALAPRGNNYIIDETGMLTKAQIEALNTKADKLSKKRKCGVYVWIVDLVPERYVRTANDLEAYIDAFYKKYDLGWGEKKNGMVLLLETGDIMFERDYQLYTYGPCKLIFHGGIKSSILYTHVSPPFYAAFDNGNFFEAADVFLDRAEKEFASNFISGLVTDFIFIVPVPVLIAWIVCSRWKRKMKTVKLARTADNYIPQGGFKLTGQTDKFLYRTTTHVEIERDTSSSSSRGGGGGSSSSSSGRSSGGKV